MNDANHILIHNRRWVHAKSRNGFSLLEVLVAIVVLVAVMSIAFEIFNATIRGWKRGTEVAEGIKHGEFSINQLNAALNSTIYFQNSRKVYAFLVEKDTLQGLPADMISFVTASGAFMPYDSPFAKSPHRLKLFIDLDDEGHSALYALPMPAVANPDDIEDEYALDPLLVSRGVSGLEILFWDTDNEEWTEEWEQENSIPERILINIYISSADTEEEPILFSRAIDIPVYDSVKERLKSPSS